MTTRPPASGLQASTARSSRAARSSVPSRTGSRWATDSSGWVAASGTPRSARWWTRASVWAGVWLDTPTAPARPSATMPARASATARRVGEQVGSVHQVQLDVLDAHAVQRCLQGRAQVGGVVRRRRAGCRPWWPARCGRGGRGAGRGPGPGAPPPTRTRAAPVQPVDVGGVDQGQAGVDGGLQHLGAAAGSSWVKRHAPKPSGPTSGPSRPQRPGAEVDQSVGHGGGPYRRSRGLSAGTCGTIRTTGSRPGPRPRPG